MGKSDMTKDMYLKELKKKLKSQFKKEEVNNVIGDYSEYFDIELEQGKKEAVICAKLGKPEEIVKKLVEEAGDKEAYLSVSIKKSFLYNAAILLLTFLAGVILIKIFRESYNIKISQLLIGYPVIAFIGWVLIGRNPFGQLQRIPEKSKMNHGKRYLLTAIHGVCFLLSLSLIVGMIYISDAETIEHLINLYGYKIGPFVSRLFYISGAVFVGIIVFSSYQIIKYHHLSYYSLIGHGMGSVVMLIGYDGIHRSLATLELYRKLITNASFIYLETLLIVFVLIAINRRRDINGRTA